MPRVRSEAEVGIVGAGPAGARLAELLAARGVEVMLWDPKAPWEKPCGGGLTAAAVRWVPELAGAVPLAQSAGSVRFETDGDIEVEVGLERPIHVISRAELGRWQLDRARAAGAGFVAQPVRSVCRGSFGWQVELAGGALCRVRHLVGADGAASLVRAAVAPGWRIALEPTRVAFPPADSCTTAPLRFLFARGVTGYAWDFPRRDHRSVGAVAESGAGQRTRLEADIDRLATGGDSAAPLPVWQKVGAVIGTALFHHARSYARIGGADFALLDDAAGLADPALGEGIPNALRSAGLAAEAFLAHRSFAQYPLGASQTFEPEFRRARRLRALLYRWGGAVRLVEAAARHRWAHGLLAGFINEENERRVRPISAWLVAVVARRRGRPARASSGRER